jgi:hypothetical protein
LFNASFHSNVLDDEIKLHFEEMMMMYDMH